MMAFEQTLKKDWYSVLGADPSANMSDLKQKYQKLLLMYHPDKQSTDVPAGRLEECIQKFIEIDQAWKILGNEETKKEYDLQRHGKYLRMEDKQINLGPNECVLKRHQHLCVRRRSKKYGTSRCSSTS
ncbi:PREDICTED: dnaJ homolog subfamily C member 24 isoform X2 [Galeopterus variegatus]|uniref:DnaJ homolog subfamily C member 24 isoform X2 n=1 Tax=Galeopterus variegatus TaxID=482537 RepID=A0ABM0QX72_GALVR|nr:PREDICTED: dnaJ homolog subfamily C member 24 isoform X2 [Galeopterus variegatus]